MKDSYPAGCTCDSSPTWLRYIGHSRLCSLFRWDDGWVGLDRLFKNPADKGEDEEC